jgi:hypothetical protein
MDIIKWLKDLGVPQYAEKFAAASIDLSVVSSLSDQDLKDLGVALMGQRRKIMAAAAEIKLAEKPGNAAPAPAAREKRGGAAADLTQRV